MWPRDDVLHDEVRPRSGEGGVKAEDGFNSAGEGERDLRKSKMMISNHHSGFVTIVL